MKASSPLSPEAIANYRRAFQQRAQARLQTREKRRGRFQLLKLDIQAEGVRPIAYKKYIPKTWNTLWLSWMA